MNIIFRSRIKSGMIEPGFFVSIITNSSKHNTFCHGVSALSAVIPVPAFARMIRDLKKSLITTMIVRK